MFVFTFAMKLKDANYKSHWNILVFCGQWKMISDLNMPHAKMSDFVSVPLFGFTLVIKLKNFDFESPWSIIWSKHFLIWFKVCCLSRVLAISWEIWILNFIETVQYFSIKKSVVRSKFVPVFFVLYVFWALPEVDKLLFTRPPFRVWSGPIGHKIWVLKPKL